QFLALFFNREKEADEYVARVSSAIKRIYSLNLSPDVRPKVIWGDIYEERVLVEPGNSWVAEMVNLAGGDYLFSDIAGGS
ncbi:MAG: ABC transporter substrate-binding protein, partial [Deltaproteobacteria bacterium]